MSHQPAAGLAAVSTLGGVMAYTRAGSVPSLVACLGVSAVMAMSSMRIRDNLDYGYEGATLGSAALLVPILRRAVITRAPIPVTISALAAASTAYYAKAIYDHQRPR